MYESTVRAAFEHWFTSGYPDDTNLCRFSDGEYHSPIARIAWEAWQAAYAKGRASDLPRVD